MGAAAETVAAAVVDNDAAGGGGGEKGVVDDEPIEASRGCGGSAVVVGVVIPSGVFRDSQQSVDSFL